MKRPIAKYLDFEEVVGRSDAVYKCTRGATTDQKLKRKAFCSGLNIYLIGMMGVGKSSIGPLLANRLGYLFFDSDQSIEKQVGMPIVSIFKEKGEAYFRSLEHAFLMDGHPAQGCVIACGGGSVLWPDMMNVLNKKGKTVWLNASPTVINNRLSHDMSRPLLWGDNRLAVIENLLMVREPYYQKALCAVSTDTSDLCGIVVEIVKKLYNLDLLRE